MDASGTIEHFTYRGLRIFYKKTGCGPPMIFLHNAGNSHVIWYHQLDYFSRSHTCYAFDLPGYGMSAHPAARFPLELYTGFLDEFIQSRNLAPVILVGNCVGSAISLTFAMSRPRAVDKLILFNVLTRQVVWKGLWGPVFRLTAPVPSLRELLHRGLRNWTVPGPFAHFAIATQFGTRGYRDPELVKKLKKPYTRKGPLGAIIDLVADIESFAPMDAFTIPEKFPETLVIWGEKNVLLPVKAGRALCEKLKPARLEIIRGGGHLVMHELHQEVNGKLAAFLGLENKRFTSFFAGMKHFEQGVASWPAWSCHGIKKALRKMAESIRAHPDLPIFHPLSRAARKKQGHAQMVFATPSPQDKDHIGNQVVEASPPGCRQDTADAFIVPAIVGESPPVSLHVRR